MSRGYIKDGQFIVGEPPKSMKVPREHSGHREFVRSDMANTYRKDLLQQWDGDKPNPAWINAYPEEARAVFTEEQVNDALRSYNE